jgi:hypothetical protein
LVVNAGERLCMAFCRQHLDPAWMTKMVAAFDGRIFR